MNRSFLLLATGIVMLASSTSAHAQGGCVNSPENPTIVLALIGSASALASAARTRFRRRAK